MARYDYDLMVIGGGSGGLTAAELGASLGARTVLIEKSDSLGGECLHAGCVPSKALISAAREIHTARFSKYGLDVSGEVDWQAVKNHIHRSIQTVINVSDNDQYFTDMGITVMHGEARFVDTHRVQVVEQIISARRIIIATGSSPRIPNVPGLSDVPFLTNETIFTMPELPKSLAVIGGGPIGCELGQALHMLGVKVTILQSAERLLPRDELAVSEAVQEQCARTGLKVVCGASLQKVERTGHALTISYEAAGAAHRLVVDDILVATGRQPNTDLDLDRAGVQANERGVRVNDYLQTSAHHIYAIGDVAGQYQFTHYAGRQAAVAVRNALFGFARQKLQNPIVPWVTFTTPEVAHFGEDEQSLQGKPHHRHELHYDEIDRAVADGQKGLLRIYTDTQDKQIIGATIIGMQAGELLGQLVALREQGATFRQLASPMYPYPTYGLGLQTLAFNELLDDYRKNQFLKLFTRRT